MFIRGRPPDLAQTDLDQRPLPSSDFKYNSGGSWYQKKSCLNSTMWLAMFVSLRSFFYLEQNLMIFINHHYRCGFHRSDTRSCPKCEREVFIVCTHTCRTHVLSNFGYGMDNACVQTGLNRLSRNPRKSMFKEKVKKS